MNNESRDEAFLPPKAPHMQGDMHQPRPAGLLSKRTKLYIEREREGDVDEQKSEKVRGRDVNGREREGEREGGRERA